jgi:hypothetical protein
MRHAWPTTRSALFGTLATCAAACSESSDPTAAKLQAGSPTSALVPRVAASATGVPYGPFHLPEANYAAPFTATIQMPSSRNGLLKILNAARRAHVRVIVRLAGGKDNYRNADGSFSLTKWKTRVSAYRGVDLSGYVADRTLIGHYLFDEPHAKKEWNGKPVPLSDVEGAAQYSKQLWPYLTTFIRSPADFLQGKTNWVYLDAAWHQYDRGDGDAAAYIAKQAAIAKRIGLGVVGGLNVLRGSTNNTAMSANEVRTFGTAILNNSAVCAFFLWKHDATYFRRTDIRQAVASLGQAAASHAATRCRVH